MKHVYLLLLTALLCACSRQGDYRRAEGLAWGTEYHITYLSDKDLSDSIVAEIAKIDASLSPFNKSSLISAVNRGEDVKVDSMFAEVFNLSQEICRVSGGVFDPTVAPLINLWGFGYSKGAADVPSQEAIDSALAKVGMLECSITPDGRVAKKHPSTEFNFSAVAKGYGVDCIAAMLRRNGCTDYMVEVGGEIALSGNGPSGDKWRIQVDTPDESEGAPTHNNLKTLQLTDICIATSGNYRNFRDTSAGRVGHTISPKTGTPVSTDMLSATVLAPDCATADALATSMMALPSAEAMQMIKTVDGCEALIVTLAPDSTYKTTQTFK